jgi:ankyrin repeat protein
MSKWWRNCKSACLSCAVTRPRISEELISQPTSKVPKTMLEESGASLPQLIAQGDICAIAKHIGEDPDLVCRVMSDSAKKDFPLIYAARLGQLPVVKWLIKSGFVSVNQLSDRGTSALLVAAQAGHFELVQWLVTEGHCALDATCGHALTGAAFGGHFKVIEWFVDQGYFLVDQCMEGGSTSLSIAAANGHLELVKWLVTKGANVSHRTADGSSPLVLAASNGHLTVIQWLIEEGNVGVEESDNHGYTSLVIAAREGHFDVVKWLVCKGKSNVHHCVVGGYNSAVCASSNGHLDIVRYLVSECNISVNGCIDFAAQNGHLEIVKWFIKEHTTSVDKDSFGRLILVATHAGQFPVVRWLVNEGAHLECTTEEGDTPLALAVLRGHLDIVKLLAGNRANMSFSEGSVLGLAAWHDQVEVVQWLIREGHAEVDEIQGDGQLALDDAVEKGHIELVQWLVTAGRAQTNLSPIKSTLQRALDIGNLRIVRILVVAGAKLATVNHITEPAIQGVLCDAVDKAIRKKIRQVLGPLGWDRHLTSLVGRYCMVNFLEAGYLLAPS